MSDDSEERPKRRRGRRDDPYANFYAMYYGLDEGEKAPQPTRHRAAAGRTGAALMAGVHALGAMVRGRAMLVLSVGLAGVGILIVGVMVSATRLAGDPAYHPSLVDGTPTGSETAISSSSAAPESSSAATSTSPGDATSAGQPIAGAPGDGVPPVYYPPTSAGVAPTPVDSAEPGNSTTSARPTASAQSTPPHTTSHPTPPRTTSSSASTPPETTSAQPTPTPTPTPTPSPTKKCVIPDPVHPGHCILFQQ